MKERAGATKITLLKEISPDVFQGSALKGTGGKKYVQLGLVCVTAAEAGLTP